MSTNRANSVIQLVISISQAMECVNLEGAILKWRETGIGNRKVKIVWQGDLQYVSYLVGHGGSATNYPCIICKM